jgi:predicted hydrolase (HD superfamily)
MKYKSVKKKVKDKAFAKAVDRDEMQRGADELGIEFSDLVMVVVKALQKREEELNEQGLSLF